MKFILLLSLNVILLFVFTTMTPSSVWACGGKGKCQKEVTEQKTKSKYQKEVTEHKAKSKCQKDCCKKPCSYSKNKKKGCCGDDCSCSPIITVFGDLPKLLSFEKISFYPVFSIKNPFFYKQAFSKSSIQDILQPPISVLAI